MSTYRARVPSAASMVRSLRAERDELLRFCATLDDAAWNAPSRAEGWRVGDVVAHIGSGCHAMFTPGALAMLRSDDIERANDDSVEVRRDWSRAQVMAEYERWSGRVCTLAAVLTRTPLTRVRAPLAELGRFPMGLLLGAALTFDHHTHLRHDLAPALGRPAPSTDAERLSVVTAWMIAVWANQLAQQPASWLGGSVALTLTGAGGCAVRVGADGVLHDPATPSTVPVIARITAPAADFPSWGTTRTSWRDAAVEITGDQSAAERLLDAIDIV